MSVWEKYTKEQQDEYKSFYKYMARYLICLDKSMVSLFLI